MNTDSLNNLFRNIYVYIYFLHHYKTPIYRRKSVKDFGVSESLNDLNSEMLTSIYCYYLYHISLWQE